MSAYEKLEALKGLISSSNGLSVAFSGGVDSTLLKAVAYEVLGGQVPGSHRHFIHLFEPGVCIDHRMGEDSG